MLLSLAPISWTSLFCETPDAAWSHKQTPSSTRPYSPQEAGIALKHPSVPDPSGPFISAKNAEEKKNNNNPT